MFIKVAIHPDFYTQAENIISIEIEDDETEIYVRGGHDGDRCINRYYKKDSDDADWYNTVLRRNLENLMPVDWKK